MLTVVETPVFSRLAAKLLTEAEREAFAVYIAQNPTAGSVVRESGGVRKIRWHRNGAGKSGGFRIVYFNQLAAGEVWLLTIFAKNRQSTIPAHELKMIRETIEND